MSSITAGEPSAWTEELLDSILWRLNLFHGQEPYVTQVFYDWASDWWEVKIFKRTSRMAYCMLKIPGEYEATKPDLRFDDIVAAIKGGLSEAEVREIDLRGYLPLDTAVATQSTVVQPPRVGTVIYMDGQQMRVIDVDLSTGMATLAPIGNTVDPAEVQREREAREAEARKIMLEALARQSATP